MVYTPPEQCEGLSCKCFFKLLHFLRKLMRSGWPVLTKRKRKRPVIIMPVRFMMMMMTNDHVFVEIFKNPRGRRNFHESKQGLQELLHSVVGSKFSRHFFNQSEVKPKPIVLSPSHFPALCVGYVLLLGVLIGLLDCLHPF